MLLLEQPIIELVIMFWILIGQPIIELVISAAAARHQRVTSPRKCPLELHLNLEAKPKDSSTVFPNVSI